MELESVADLRRGFYRFLNVLETDASLRRGGNPQGAVAAEYLTRGLRATQRLMLDNGYHGWLDMHTLVFDGDHNSPLGRSAPEPADMLKAYGTRDQSAIVDQNGRPWGSLVTTDHFNSRGNGYYVRGDRIVLLPLSQPPQPAFLIYHKIHPAIPFEDESSFTLEMPMEARAHIVAKAAALAREEGWVPGDEEMARKIDRALGAARDEARRAARRTKDPRRMKPVRRYGNHW